MLVSNGNSVLDILKAHMKFTVTFTCYKWAFLCGLIEYSSNKSDLAFYFAVTYPECCFPVHTKKYSSLSNYLNRIVFAALYTEVRLLVSRSTTSTVTPGCFSSKFFLTSLALLLFRQASMRLIWSFSSSILCARHSPIPLWKIIATSGVKDVCTFLFKIGWNQIIYSIFGKVYWNM